MKSLTAKIEAVAEKPFNQQVEYAAPDRYRVKLRDSAGAETEMIMDGKDAYVKSGDSWKKMEGETPPTPTMRSFFTDEALKSISDVKFLGEESVNGMPALAYSYKLETVVGNVPVSPKLWVSKSSGLPMKCYVQLSSGAIKALTITFDTDSPVTIELPSKK